MSTKLFKQTILRQKINSHFTNLTIKNKIRKPILFLWSVGDSNP